MARTAKAAAAAPATAPANDQQSQQDDGYLNDLQAMLGDLGGVAGARLSVSRMPETNPGGKFTPGQWLFDAQMSDFPEMGALFAKLRDDYGGGAYRISIRDGKRQIVNRSVHIGEPVSREPAAPVLVHQPAPAAAPQQDMAAAISEIGRMMMQGQMDIMKLMLQQSGKSANGGGLGMQDAIALAQLLKGDQRSPIEQIGELVKVQQMIGGGRTDGEGGASSAESNTNDVLITAMKSLPVLVELVKSAGAQAAQQAQQPQRQLVAQPQAIQQQQPGAPAQQQQAGQPAAAPEVAMPADFDPVQFLQGVAPLILNAAMKDGDPSTYADLLLDLAPDASQFAAMLQQPNAVQIICQIEPQFSPYVEWLEKLRAEIMELMDGESASDSAASGLGELVAA